ncbi:uncharacterized protein K452DRAFT_266078 [Aplosporella prunicola CBS 121167]|uniref:FAD-binding domain-containing protein n=1 Tax=Aplosporella prunicola CBS 121167 TaxID=1176127 RepID=A0A6A6BR49_9PEZI|nr:uncharacterized protein K452DRAFT_266078 [Aplosporella prunicola CBS 121167]KAF2145287.1 hypothetical protein K452DRAFT_266078 [Aplosporella prunicola CBS 121167]
MLSILIVGAGLGGLAASIECARSGHKVTVLEAARSLTEIGAGLQLTPNATRLLHTWAISTSALKAVEPARLQVHRFSGPVLADSGPGFAAAMRARYAAPFADVHRADLHAALVARARALGVVLRVGERVDALDLDLNHDLGLGAGQHTARVRTVHGKTWDADVVVAADGLWSRCRECVLGRADAPLPTGDLAFRVVLGVEQIADAQLRAWVRANEVHFWIGPRAHAVGYCMRAGELYNLVLLVPDDLPADVARQRGSSVEEMRRLFEGWDPILTRLLSHVSAVDKWKLMHRPALDSWLSPRANLALLGDACHPMLPYLAQGANSALEDGAVLGRALAGVVAPGPDVQRALRLFQRLRKARGEKIARESFMQREAFHLPDGPEQEARDALFLSKLGGEIDCAFPSRWTCPEIQPWLYGYDAFKEVDYAASDARD